MDSQRNDEDQLLQNTQACVTLPTLLGTITNDSKRGRAPAFSFGSRANKHSSKKLELKVCNPVVFKWKKDSNLNLHQTYEIYNEGDIDNIEKQGRLQLELDEEALSILDTSLPGRQRVVIRDPYYRYLPPDLAERRTHGVVEEIPEPIEEEDEDGELCPYENVCATPSSQASSPYPFSSNGNRTGNTTGYSPSSPLAYSFFNPNGGSRIPAHQSLSSGQPTTRSLQLISGQPTTRSLQLISGQPTTRSLRPTTGQPTTRSLRTGQSPPSRIHIYYSPTEQSYNSPQMVYSMPNSYGGSQVDFDTSNMYPMQPTIGKPNRPYNSSSRNNLPPQEPCYQYEQTQDSYCQSEPPPENTCCQFQPQSQDTCCHPSVEHHYQYEQSSPPPSLEEFHQFDPNPYQNYDTNVYNNASTTESECVRGHVCARSQMPNNNYGNQVYGVQPNYNYTAAYPQELNYNNKNMKNTNYGRGYMQPDWTQMNSDIGNNDESYPIDENDGEVQQTLYIDENEIISILDYLNSDLEGGDSDDEHLPDPIFLKEAAAAAELDSEDEEEEQVSANRQTPSSDLLGQKESLTSTFQMLQKISFHRV
ncbi:uncharacterized protein LOC142331936 [Lycorma delicatula]|uniref:uncharacterized protein LOC142331936 n=1 Tax=Lycorma delicatula TaxID=130591 RepID=UPI003F511FF0